MIYISNCEVAEKIYNYLMANEYKYGQHTRQLLDVYPAKDGPTGAPIIIFFHGGSWQGGDKSGYKFMGKALTKLGSTVVIPNYRLYPEVKFPSFIEDGALAVAWVAKEYPSSKIVLMGHSAGAHIASILAFDEEYLMKVGVAKDKVSGFIGISGPYNFTLSPKIEPVFSNSAKQLWNPLDKIRYSKPTLLIYGFRDKTVATSNSEDLVEKLIDLGGKPKIVRFSLLGHITILVPFVFHLYGFRKLRRIIEQFIKEAQ